MAITSTATVADIMNRVAAEVGLGVNNTPLGSGLEHFVQMKHLLQTCGEELALANQWEFLTEEHQITTAVATNPAGDYDLPTDFHYMIPQTGWERNENVPLFGPLNAQEWTYLLGRGLGSTTIYASFRIREGLFSIFPQPPADGLDVNFEYQRTTWVLDVDGSTQKTDIVTDNDKPYFDRTLITRMLKLKFLEAKGFDTTKPQDDFNQVYGFLVGKDNPGEILAAGGGGRGYPYLDTDRSTPDSGYGS